jgi:hypothetical protein
MAEAVPAAEPLGSDLRAPHAWVLWAIAVAAIGIITGTLVLALASSQLDRLGLRSLLVGWIVVPYVVSGILAWWRRPASRLGPLMVATGFATALAPLQWVDQPMLYSIGHLFDMLPAALFLHVFLAFPTGKLSGTAERVVVIACYVAVLGLQVVKILLGITPDSVLAISSNPEVANWVEGFQLCIVAALLLVGAALLFLRRRRDGRTRRRPTALIVDAFGLALVMLALLYVAGALSWPAFDTIRLVTLASLGLAPIAFLFALLDARLARGQVAALVVEPACSFPLMTCRHPCPEPCVTRRWSWRTGCRSTAAGRDQNGQILPTPQADHRRALRIVSRMTSRWPRCSSTAR